MRFPRRARLLRGPFDATAYAAVFFGMIIFLSLGSRLYTPGVQIRLPEVADQPGVAKPTVTVALDQHGAYFFQNQPIEPALLRERLREIAQTAPEPMALLILMDKGATIDDLLQLQSLGRDAGMPDSLIATLPQVIPPKLP